MEAANQIFAAAQIDTCFASDSRVDLGEERRGDLQDRDAAHEDSREEASDIGDNASAEANDEAAAVGAAFHHLLGEIFDVGEPLFGFAGRQKENRRSVSNARIETRSVQVPNIALRDNEQLARARRHVFESTLQNAALDKVLVGRVGSLDLERRHALML